MNNEDLQKLKAAAEGALNHSDTIGEEEWYSGTENIAIFAPSPDLTFIAASKPDVILELIAIVEKSLAAPTVAGAVLSDEQIEAAVQRGYSRRDGIEMDAFDIAFVVEELRAILAAAAPLYAAAQATHHKKAMTQGDIHRITCEEARKIGGKLVDMVPASDVTALGRAIAARLGFGLATTGDAAIGEKGNG